MKKRIAKIAVLATLMLLALASLASAKLVMGRDLGGAVYWYDPAVTPGALAVSSFGALAPHTVSLYSGSGNPHFTGNVGTKVVDKFGNVAYGTGWASMPARFRA